MYTFTINNIAKISYEAFRQLQQILGDYSYPPWCELSEDLQLENRKLVENILHELATSGEVHNGTSLNSIKERLFAGITTTLRKYIQP